jgi:hypothetical protein
MNASSDVPEVVFDQLADRPADKRRRRRSESPATPATAQAVGQTSSGEANRRAAAILEVLAGERSPSEAAEALEVSLPYFYLLERKALEGLVRACEVQPKGPPPPSAAERLTLVEQQLAAAQRECQRLAALVRVTQRAVGLPGPAPGRTTGRTAEKPSKSDGTTADGNSRGKRTRRRRPSVRALRAAQTVRRNAQEKEASCLQTAEAVVQPAIVENGSAAAPAAKDREAGASPS